MPPSASGRGTAAAASPFLPKNLIIMVILFYTVPSGGSTPHMHRRTLRHGAATARLWWADGVVWDSVLDLVPPVEVPDTLRVSADGRGPEHLYL